MYLSEYSMYHKQVFARKLNNINLQYIATLAYHAGGLLTPLQRRTLKPTEESVLLKSLPSVCLVAKFQLLMQGNTLTNCVSQILFHVQYKTGVLCWCRAIGNSHVGNGSHIVNGRLWQYTRLVIDLYCMVSIHPSLGYCEGNKASERPGHAR